MKSSTIETRLLKFLLMRKAVLLDGDDIEPCINKTWSECFTVECGKWLCLWYTVKATGSTKIVKLDYHE